MAEYIATFFSHFGAIRFHRALKNSGIEGVMMPVPRKVSSSCGTCVRFSAETQPEHLSEDVEAIFRKEGESWVLLLSNGE